MRTLDPVSWPAEPVRAHLRRAATGAIRRVTKSIRSSKTPTSVESPPTERPRSASIKTQNVSELVEVMTERLEGWIEEARHAAGHDVVAIFSVGPMYDSANLSRPAHIAAVLLEESCPVFYSFDSGGTDAVSSHYRQGLMQSRTDMTSRILPQLLEADFGDKKKVLVVGFPHELMVRYISYASQHGWRVVYDVYADWEESARLNGNVPYEPAYEWYVSKNAHVVSAVPGALARKLATVSGREVALTRNAPSRGLQVAQPVDDLWQSVVGFPAALSGELIDWDLVIRCALRYPSVRFEIAGASTSRDAMPENIRQLGPLSGVDRSRVISRWGGGIVPLVFSPASESIDPIALHDLVAAGLSVVTTYLPQVRDYPAVRVAESPEEFIELVGSLVEEGVVRRESGGAWLSANGWANRVEKLRAELDQAPHPRSVVAFLTGTVH